MKTGSTEAPTREHASIQRLLSDLDTEECLALLAALERGRGGNMKEAMRDFVVFLARRQGGNVERAVKDFEASCEARAEVA